VRAVGIEADALQGERRVHLVAREGLVAGHLVVMKLPELRGLLSVVGHRRGDRVSREGIDRRELIQRGVDAIDFALRERRRREDVEVESHAVFAERDRLLDAVRFGRDGSKVPAEGHPREQR
jgi:hypothetical protein